MLALWEYTWPLWALQPAPLPPIPLPPSGKGISVGQGAGFRSVWSMMIEMSYHLLEPTLFTTLTSPVPSSGTASPSIASLGSPVNALYVGANIVIDPGNTSQEIVAVTAFNPATSSFTANFQFTHGTGAQVIGPTFPVQAISGDPFFTQSEIASYIARAQNEFLAQVPCIFGINTQTVQFGQIYQQLVCDAIEMHRVAASTLTLSVVSLTRANGIVIAVSSSPHGLIVGQKFSIMSAPDPSFNGAFKVASVLSPTSWAYKQYQPDAVIAGGTVGLWVRLYETSQEELSIQDPFWRNQNLTRLSSWYEDRTGNYRWGVNGKPSTNLPVEVLVSVRDTDILAMTDPFLVPDLFLHFVKYKALQYAWSKDGEQRNKMLADYAGMRFDRGVMTALRWMDGTGVDMATQKVSRG